MFILWGFFHRCGGGLITIPGNKILFRGLCPAILLALLHQDWWILLTAPGFYLGNQVTGYSQHWNMNNSKDWIYMTIRGVLFTLFAGFILACINLIAGIILIFSGLIMGISYWIGKKWPNKGQGMMQGPECSEFVFGFMLGLINSLTKIL